MLAPDMGKQAHKAISFQNQFFWVIKTSIAAYSALIVLQTARGKRFLCSIIEHLKPFPLLRLVGYGWACERQNRPPSTCRCKAVWPLPMGVALLVGARKAYISSSSAYSSSPSDIEGSSSSVASCTPEMMKSYSVLGFFCSSTRLYTFFPPGIW